MKWISEENVACYAGEHITVRSTADKSILFTGIIKGLKFYFNFSSDNIKENNTVECNMLGLAECRYYPLHIIGSSCEECRGQYGQVYENKSADTSHDNFSQHTFSFEKSNGEILFTAKLLKNAHKDWFETAGGNRRQRPPYNLLHYEKTQGIGYAENIYLHPIKQLIAASMKNKVDVCLTCDFGSWYYTLEEYVEIGQLIYPDGRMVIVENANNNVYWHGMKLFRPGFIVKDYVEISGERVWYVATYSPSSNDNEADTTVIFQSDYTKNAVLKFEGSFIRRSVKRADKVNGRVRGYIAYYQVKGLISTVGKDYGEASENIDLYSDETTIEKMAVSSLKHEVFALIDEPHYFSNNQHTITPTRTIGLDDLVGMNKVKQAFAELRTFGEYRRALSLSCKKQGTKGDMLLDLYKHNTHTGMLSEVNNDAVSLHMAFLGSPGTGKTTVAERIASMLKEFGLVITNEIPVIVVKSDLVGKYIGHTEEIVRKKIEEAIGGILFVDEAYTLFDSEGSNDFGRIALNEIMYAMERCRDNLVVILAGYTDEMLYMLKNANPGLTSRIPWYFFFCDYSADEMWEILKLKVEKNGYKFDSANIKAIKTRAVDYFTMLKKEMDGIREEGKTKHLFGNGRGVRTFFQYMQIGLAVRLGNSDSRCADLHTFKVEEIDFAYNTFRKGAEKLGYKAYNKVKIGFGNS